MNLNDKVALITGGASGIGLACAKEFLANGIKGVALVDINGDGGNNVVKELNEKYGNKTIFAKANVSDKSELRAAFQKTIETFDALHIILNNAGIANEFEATKCYDVNLIGVTNGIQLAMDEFLPKYKSSGDHGIVVNVSSVQGLYPKKFYMTPVYTASKCAVLGLTLAFGHTFHYERTGVKVIAVCPGKTVTALSSTVDPNNIIHVEEFSRLVQELPCQEANELAKNLIMVLGQASNGSIWKMDAGQIEEIDYLKLD